LYKFRVKKLDLRSGQARVNSCQDYFDQIQRYSVELFLKIMTDYHCHLLPCIDDGPSTIDESIEMARLLSKAGYHTVYCTPHLIKGRYEADNNSVKKSINDLQETLNRNGIPLKLLHGREYYLDSNFMDYLDDLMPLENTSNVLIEIPPHTYPGMVEDSLSAIMRQNLTPMLAHPERCELFVEKKITDVPRKKATLKSLFHRINSSPLPLPRQEEESDNKLLLWMIGNKCAFQSNLPSFKGIYGEKIQATAQYLDSLGVYTHSGTDAHSPGGVKKLFGFDELQ
jgi:protein-tyrosine phosphatase